ncbi:MAG TPA: NAD-dependent epimerase/dehydratase family protein, partial [Phycisphaerae bacterium]|nr:NAD-dependent epimerase/dehydratase family protein [Phycisphaerae bacterium]
RGSYPELSRLGIRTIRGDLSDIDTLKEACTGCDTAFHVAALAGVWGPRDEYFRVNVSGTRNVIDACRAAGIKQFIYTSSPSVVFNGSDMEGVNESAPYATRFLAPYPESKAIAEQLVRQANGPGLATVALRPHLIWGPGDTHLVPRIISRAEHLRRIGGLNKLVDSTYIDNAADAHVLAADKLAAGAPLGGRVYFISNGEPRGVWSLVNAILAAGHLPPVTRSVPKPLAFAAARCSESAHRWLNLRGEPRLTRFVAKELTTAHWFDISAARRDLGYDPKVTLDDGLAQLASWLNDPNAGP